MNRREFIATGALAAAAPGAETSGQTVSAPAADFRALFPRLERERYLAAAAGTPLSTFTGDALRAYEDYWRFGPGDGRIDTIRADFAATRSGLADLLGAKPNEIAFVHCTKEGEQIVLDGLPSIRDGGNVVTNDLHFGGSLGNLLGLQRAGVDVRIVANRDWRTDIDAMREAIDDSTALVSVALVSNINGNIEPIRELAEIAHAHGAYVYADVIQAAGIVPLDVRAMGIDFAAGNGYKWLFGPHGAGYLYVAEEHQGSALQDRVFPGGAWANYAPWVETPDGALDPVARSEPLDDSRRYEPGHVGYLNYAALNAGLRFVAQVGVEHLLAHSVSLNTRLLDNVDASRSECLTPDPATSPIVTFLLRDTDGLGERFAAANLALGNGPAPRERGPGSPLRQRPRLRVSPAIYNTADDMDALAAAMNG